MNDRKLVEALSVFEISESASINDIKDRYKSLIKKWHPDKYRNNPEESKEMSQKITLSYRIILEHCMNYKFSFNEKVETEDSDEKREEFWKEHFGDDPLMC